MRGGDKRARTACVRLEDDDSYVGRLSRGHSAAKNQGTELATPVCSTGPSWAALGVALAAVQPNHALSCRIDRLSVLDGYAWH